MKQTVLEIYHQEGMIKRKLIVNGWDVVFNGKLGKSFAVSINDSKNLIKLSSNKSVNIIKDADSCDVDNRINNDNITTLRFKALGLQQVENNWSHRASVTYFHLNSQLGKNKRKITCDVFRVHITTITIWSNGKVIYQFGY